MYGDEGFLTTMLLFNSISTFLSWLFPLAVGIWVFWMIKKSRKGQVVPQPIEYPPGILALQQLMQVLIQSAGPISSGQRTQFINTFGQAQSELNQLDDLRRQQSELRLGDMRAQAASMGIFLD